MMVLHIESDFKKYSALLAINVFNANGERVCKGDEPNCCLMLYEPICYTQRGHIVGLI